MPLPPLTPPPDRRQRVEAVVYGVPGTALLLGTLLSANAAQTASLAVLPFSRKGFRAVNRAIANAWYGLCWTLAQKLYGVELVLTGDEVPPEENVLVLVNHQQMPDIPVLLAFAQRQRRHGDTRFFVKESLKWVPGIGWGMQFLDHVFVKRNWTADRDYVTRTFAKFVDERLPLWLILFAEGTRVTPPKVARSQEFARARGLRPTEHVLLPRTHGFIASIEGLRMHLDAVYDITVGYERGVPDLVQYVKGYVRRVHLHVRRFPMEELPHDEAGLAHWVTERYEEKDRLLAHYYRHGRFPDRLAEARP